MKSFLFFSVLGFLWSVLAVADTPSSSIVSYMSGKDTVQGYLCAPTGDGPHPAVILIHEWWGLTDWVKDNAKTLAAQGYVALCIDLYRGHVAADADEAHQLMRGLPEDRAARDLRSAFAYLKTRKDVNGAKVGSLGWCMGGGYSLAAALNIPELAACAICYGRLVTDSSAIQKIPCPLLGIFGEDDKGITPASVNEFAAACKQSGKTIDVKIYQGAGHAFMNPGNKDGYRDASAKDAWGRINAFLKKNLQQ